MKQRQHAVRILGIVLVSLLSATQSPREKVLCEIIHQGIRTWHVQPQAVDDRISQKTLAIFQKNLDSTKSFLLQKDIDQLRIYEKKIDDAFVSGSLDIARSSNLLLRRRVEQVRQYCLEILQNPFDFSKREWIEMDPDHRSYSQTPEELKEWWRKQIKYFALLRYVELLKPVESSAPEGEKAKKKLTPREMEAQVRKELGKSMERFFRRLLQERDDEVDARLINSLIASLDPHSRYWPPRDKEDFDIEMSGTLEGIGVLMGEADGDIKILDVIPGGPAWNHGQIKVDDAILRVTQKKEESVDTMGMPVSDVARLIRGKKGTEVSLTIRKPDGRILDVSLVRNIIEIKETLARSAVLMNDSTRIKVGYIYLPKFYRDFSRNNGRSSAEDVRLQLESLEKKNVNGIILDLRNNGGGALDDSITLSGLFIEKGPILQVKDKNSEKRVLSDPDPSIQYRGPLVVLVNALSASASEIVAGALQDYRRAVIVGGGHTFGKGTVQVMLDLDNAVREDEYNVKPLGAFSLTTQKFYRITGASMQYRGVIPDIIVPEATSFLEIGERYLDNSLPWNSIQPVPYSGWRQSMDLPEIQKRSRQRIQNSLRFTRLLEYYHFLQDQRNRNRFSLNLDQFLKEQQRLWDRAKEMKKWQENIPHLRVFDLEEKEPLASLDHLNSDEIKMQKWLQELRRDEIVNEAVQVVADLCSGKKS